MVPIPLELLLVPLMLHQRGRIWQIATAVLLGCVIGSLLGYVIGYLLFDSAGIWLIEQMGWQEYTDTFRNYFERSGFAAILLVGVLPIPFQLAMLMAGAAQYPMYWFVLAVFIARGLRYFGLAWLISRFGNQAMTVWNEHKKAVVVGCAAVLGGWLMLTLV